VSLGFPAPRLLILALGLGLACRGTLSPLSNKLKVGQEQYVVFTADGEEGKGDLFASAPSGGKAYQITFSRVDEELPALSPDGTMLAFIRSATPGETSTWSLVVMNLLSGTERRVGLRENIPTRLAWSADGGRIFLQRATGPQTTPAPPALLSPQAVPIPERESAESSLAVMLGDPPQAEAVPCPDGVGLCARRGNRTLQTFAERGSAPARWLGDSVAYLEKGEWIIRPLAGGRTRVLSWTTKLTRPRDLTVFRGLSGPGS
jgi:hypothetical protein